MKLKILVWACLLLGFCSASGQQVVQATYGAISRPTPKFGFNTNAHIPTDFPPGYSGANWTLDWFVDSTEYLYPEILRYPGGTNANHWDWQTGWYFPPYQPPSGPSLTIRTDEFKAGIQACQGEGLYVVNMETSTVQYEMDGLRHADSIGLTPTLIELGNEHNLDGGVQFPLQLMTPATYAQLAKVYYDSILMEFPSAKICAVGGNTPAIPYWLDTLLIQIPTIDAISFHVYLNANNADLAFNVNRALAVPFGPNTNTSSLLYRYNMSGFNTLAPDKEVWVTEFNLLESPTGIPAVISQTWTHVLYNIAMCNFFLEKPNVTMILNHSLAGDDHFQAISRQDQHITANALSMKLLYDMSRGSETCQDMTFTDDPVMMYGTSAIPKLTGWKFNFPDVEKGFICNFSQDTFAISLAPMFLHPMQFEQYFADTALVVNGISSLNKYSGTSSDTILVYPFSITQINSVILTGVTEFFNGEDELDLYPNPARNVLNIQSAEYMSNAEIYICDMTGKTVIRQAGVSGNSFLVSIEELSKGTYFVKLCGENNTLTGRFIVY